MEQRQQSSGEEIANSITHGIGVLLSIVGLIILMVLAGQEGDVRRIVSFGIYGLSLIILYTASTLYHVSPPGSIKRFFRVLDHSAIFLLIAGTYTPFTLVALRGAVGWTLFSVIWGLAVIGIMLEVCVARTTMVFSTVIYLIMGWLALSAIRPIIDSITFHGLLWLLAGGLFYTLGIIFHFLKRLPFHHTLWHIFVLAGGVCHYLTILVYV